MSQAFKQGLAHRGLAMIELMVAMLLGLLLMAALLQIFLNASKTYQVQEEFARLQENGRFALEFLKRDIRVADYWGCTPLADITNQLNATSLAAFSFAQGVNGVDGGSSYPATAGLAPDALTLRGATGGGVNVLPPFTKGPVLTVEAGHGFAQGDLLLVGDCGRGDIFQATTVAGTTIEHSNAPGTPGNASPNFVIPYNEEAELYKVNSHIYTIGTGTGLEPALFRDGNELVEGVENMQLLFGEDRDGDGTIDFYIPPASVVDMNAVLAIQVDLVLRSLRDNLTDTPQAVSYASISYNPGDRRIRKVFSSNVAIRSRLD